uniref:Uncharacterized protein n=1 Tax=Marseillevirus LCMAC103 TaxID=2506604 RepID=A0A481YUI4_9VIRU|nr:MAG: hypothetical protein LCMAC103_01800 [Marseillevirus LCMAC103]
MQVARDLEVHTLVARTAARIPDKKLALEPVRPPGSLMYDVDNRLVYVSDGLAWRTVSGYGALETIASVGDFPAAVAGVHTLAADTVYLIDGLVDIGTNRLVMGAGTVIAGRNRDADILRSATTGALITATSNMTVDNITITCTGVGSEVFNCVFSAPSPTQGDRYEIRNCYFFQCQSMGFLDGGLVGRYTSNHRNDSENGLELRGASGSTHFFYHLNVNHGNNAGIDLLIATGTFTIIDISGCHFHPVFGATALDIADTITIGDGIVTSNSFRSFGGAFLAVGAGKVSNATAGWVFQGNGGTVADSDHFAEMTATDHPNTTFVDFNHLTNTALPDDAANLPLPVMCIAPGAWTAGNNMRFTFSLVTNDEVSTGLAGPNPEEVPVPAGTANDNGRLTHNGESTRCYNVVWKGAGEVSSGGNRGYQFLLGHGNTTESVIASYADAGGGDVTVTTGTHGLSVGDMVFIRRSGSSAAWQFLGPHAVTAVPSTTTFEFTFRDPVAGGFPGGGLTGGEWVLCVDKSRTLIDLDNNDKRVFVVIANVILDPDDFVEPFVQYDSPNTGTAAHLRVTASHNVLTIND